MRNLKLPTLIFLLITGLSGALAAQQKKSMEVVTRLQEVNGNYNERKLYRAFLTEAMKQCPYIDHFHIIEVPGSEANHDVEWIYEVSNWGDITKFYHWMNSTIRASKDSTLIKALTPYRPVYDLGGVIDVHKSAESLVKH